VIFEVPSGAIRAIRAIRALATTQQVLDGLLIHIITRKLDQRTREKWEEDLSITELSTWDAMESFLENRCRMLENLDQVLVNQTPGQHVGKNLHKYNQNTLIASATNSNHLICLFCHARDHYLPKCSRFLNLSSNLRYREAKKLHLCINCLRKGHSLQQCKSTHCKYCPIITHEP